MDKFKRYYNALVDKHYCTNYYFTGLCDSYVRVGLHPEDTFANVTKPKTQTHNKNLFPLYDEMFLV